MCYKVRVDSQPPALLVCNRHELLVQTVPYDFIDISPDKLLGGQAESYGGELDAKLASYRSLSWFGGQCGS